MFVDLTGMDRGCLRQGDILSHVPFLILDSDNLRIIGKADLGATQTLPPISPVLNPHRGDPNYFTAQVQMRLSYGTVISQCCELEPRHGKLIGASFSVARLVPIKETILMDADKLASLRSNPDPRLGVRSFLDYFHIESNPRIEAKEWMVDFSQVVSLPKTEFPSVLARKILQFDDQTRAKFKIKLAAYYGRLTTEELEAGLDDPWSTVH